MEIKRPEQWITRSDEAGMAARVGCVCIVGMAGAGKSTVGRELAKILRWEFVDSDHLIESAWGHHLQTIVDAMSTPDFLDLEATVIKSIGLKRCVLSTGGSVVYRPEAVEHLRKLGPVVHLEVSLPVILERIARKPDRGLAIKPGQTVEDLFNERRVLYEAAADITEQGGPEAPTLYAQKIAEQLRSRYTLID